MSGREFEVFICELFKATGKYKKVVLTQESNDGGKDIILTDKSGRITYVETKRWNEKFECGRVLLQKLAGSAYGDRVDKMIFITTSGYNKNAIEYAKKLDNLELWDMSNIMKLVTIVEQEKLSNILVKSLGVNSKVVNLQPCKL
jgi:restriction endonuclease Mrr